VCKPRKGFYRTIMNMQRWKEQSVRMAGWKLETIGWILVSACAVVAS
jgi:hypothetical protein